MAERWLVIDDSATIQRVIKLAFQDYDVAITEAESCPEASRELSKAAPTLVIADAALAGVQSVQDFVALQQLVPSAVFVILEGSYDHIDEAQFRSVGFKHFLKKPFDAAQLIATTRGALGRNIPKRGEQQELRTDSFVSPSQVVPESGDGPRGMLLDPSDEGTPGTAFPLDDQLASSSFDLGLDDSPKAAARSEPLMARNPFADEPRSGFGGETASRASQPDPMAETIAKNPFSDNPGTGAGRPSAFGDSPTRGNEPFSRGAASEFSRTGTDVTQTKIMPVNFSLDDDEPQAQAARERESMPTNARDPLPNPYRDFGTNARDPLPNAGVDAPSPSPKGEAGLREPLGNASLQGMLQPMLQQEMEKLVRAAVEDYCRRNFAELARELIVRELDRLTQERSRLLVDK